MSGDNGAHLELAEKEPTLTMKESMTYRSAIANLGPAYVFFFPFPVFNLSYDTF